MSVSVILVALNEEPAIGDVLRSLPLDALRAMGHEVEVLVVDGGSSDATRAIAEACGARVLRCARGYGRQYQAGFAASSSDIIVTLDADGSYPTDLIPHLVALLEREQLDFISVNRFAAMSADAMSALHRFGNRVLTLTANLLFGLHLRDSQSGMWTLRRALLQQLRLTSNGMSFSEELKLEAFSKGRSREVPGRYAKRTGVAKIRSWRDGLHNLLFLFWKRLSCLAP
jgi:glycosyltransferase involved in cell wall biosynthesis